MPVNNGLYDPPIDDDDAAAWLRYVTFADIPAYEARGWSVHSQMQGNHGHYGVLMIWDGKCRPTAIDQTGELEPV